MSDRYYKEKLYPLQDHVLRMIGETNSLLYLTGRTVLGRFLLNHRYSDDLDFFVNADPLFSEHVEAVMKPVSDSQEVSLATRQESFIRYFIHQDEMLLKIEFVNDVKYRVGFPVRHPLGFLCDTWENILSNKISALSRDAAKDFVDILFLSLKYPFNWEVMMDHAKGKDAAVNEIEVSERLMHFDLSKLSDVVFPDTFPVNQISKNYFEILARESLHGFSNSLYGKTLH